MPNVNSIPRLTEAQAQDLAAADQAAAEAHRRWLDALEATGRDPEIRSFGNGGKVANLSVPTSETWKNKQSGERKERTEWHRVAIFNEALVGLAERFLKKGSKVYLEGQLETRKWQDQSGQDRYSTEVVLRPFRGEMTFLDGRQGGGSSEPSSGAASPQQEDEIPF